MGQQGRMRLRDHLEMKGTPEGLECGLIPFTEYFFSLQGFQPFHIIMVMVDRSWGANLLAVWDVLFQTQWAQTLSCLLTL